LAPGAPWTPPPGWADPGGQIHVLDGRGRPAQARGRAEDQLLVELGGADVQGHVDQARVQLLHRRGPRTWRARMRSRKPGALGLDPGLDAVGELLDLG